MVEISIIGSGFVGRGWAVCFARAGHRVRLWDPAAGAAAEACDYIAAMLPDLGQHGLLGDMSPESTLEAIAIADSLEQAVAGAVYIQENAPEQLEVKQRLFSDLDRLAPQDAVLASSTSALLPSAITEGLPGRARCIVAHPVNPPHLIPLVELVPSPWTAPETVARAESLMAEIGQTPVRVEREIDGFLLNRLQTAVLDEAFRLVDGGYASVEAVDACMSDGLAPRWSFMGPFETIDLNAPGGVRDYVTRYQGMFMRLADTMRYSADWTGPALDTVEEGRRARLPEKDLRARQMWRDRKLMAHAAFRHGQI